MRFLAATSTVSVTGDAGSVTDDTYPVIVRIKSWQSGIVYTTSVAAQDNGAFAVSMPYIAKDVLSISLIEGTPNPVTVGPVNMPVPVIPTLNTSLVRMVLLPAASNVSVRGSAGAVSDDVYPVTVSIQSRKSGIVYTTSVQRADNGAFSVTLPWVAEDELSISVVESTPEPVTVGPVNLGSVPPWPRLPFDHPVQALDINGALAAAGDDGGTVRLYDISTPANPLLLGELHTGYPVKRLRLAGDKLYVMQDRCCNIGFDIVDISDPANPVVVKSAYDFFSFRSYAMDAITDYAFPAPNASFQQASYSVAVSGGQDTITMFLEDPQMEYNYSGWVILYPLTYYPAWYFGVHGNFREILIDPATRYLYAMTETTLLVFDVFNGDLFDWNEIGRINTGFFGNANRMKIHDGYAYIATQSGLEILSLARLGSPDFGTDNNGDGIPDDIIGHAETHGAAGDLAVIGNLVYVPDSNNGGITVIDASNPSAPVETGAIRLDAGPYTLKAVQSVLFVGDSKGLSVIDLNPQ
jgi:hypothetical protein